MGGASQLDLQVGDRKLQDETKDATSAPEPSAEARAMGRRAPEDAGAATAASQAVGHSGRTLSPWLAGVAAALFVLIIGVGLIDGGVGMPTTSAPSGTEIEATTVRVIQMVSPSVVQIQGRGIGA